MIRKIWWAVLGIKAAKWCMSSKEDGGYELDLGYMLQDSFVDIGKKQAFHF